MLHKNSYVCFNCRKVFIRRAHWMTREIEDKNHRGRKRIVSFKPIDKATCSECDGMLFNMGAYFKAPKRADVKQWRKIEKLRLNGERFNYWGDPNMPRELWEVDDYLERRDDWQRNSAGEKLLRKIKRKSGE